MLTTRKKHIQAIDTQAPPGLFYLGLGGVLKGGGKEPSVIQAMKQKLEKMEGVEKC